MKIVEVVIAGTEYNPKNDADIQRMRALGDENASKMNDLFYRYFGLDPRKRYMGSFPYPDVETGACCIADCLSMKSFETRDAIVASLRAAIKEAKLTDIVVEKSDSKRNNNSIPARMSIVAMGPSITNNLVGEQRINDALVALESWLTRS